MACHICEEHHAGPNSPVEPFFIAAFGLYALFELIRQKSKVPPKVTKLIRLREACIIEGAEEEQRFRRLFRCCARLCALQVPMIHGSKVQKCIRHKAPTGGKWQVVSLFYRCPLSLMESIESLKVHPNKE